MFNGASIEQKPSGHDRVRESIDFTVGGNDIRVRGDWRLAGETCLSILGRRLPPGTGQLSSRPPRRTETFQVRTLRRLVDEAVEVRA